MALEEYNLHVVCKHTEVTEGMKQHILDKLEKIEKITDQIIDVYVRLDIEKKINHNVSITLKFSHTKVQAHASTTDLYVSIDQAIEKLKTKVKKWKSKIQQHHSRVPKVEQIDIDILESFNLEEINDEIDDANSVQYDKEVALPKVEKVKSLSLKTLTLEEAMMKMELSHDYFLLYRSEEDQKLKVIYRRRDASYGVIAPE